jgi:hypothetical protein
MESNQIRPFIRMGYLKMITLIIIYRQGFLGDIQALAGAQLPIVPLAEDVNRFPSMRIDHPKTRNISSALFVLIVIQNVHVLFFRIQSSRLNCEKVDFSFQLSFLPAM